MYLTKKDFSSSNNGVGGGGGVSSSVRHSVAHSQSSYLLSQELNDRRVQCGFCVSYPTMAKDDRIGREGGNEVRPFDDDVAYLFRVFEIFAYFNIIMYSFFLN